MSDKLNENAWNYQNKSKSTNVQKLTKQELLESLDLTEKEIKQYRNLRDIYNVFMDMNWIIETQVFFVNLEKYWTFYKKSSPQVQEVFSWKIEMLMARKFSPFYMEMKQIWMEDFIAIHLWK